MVGIVGSILAGTAIQESLRVAFVTAYTLLELKNQRRLCWLCPTHLDVDTNIQSRFIEERESRICFRYLRIILVAKMEALSQDLT